MANWTLLDDNPATVDIVAEPSNLYQRHADGSIFTYTGTPLTGWLLLDDNPATVDIVADNQQLYQRHSDGSIFRYTGTPLTGGSCWTATRPPSTSCSDLSSCISVTPTARSSAIRGRR